MLYAKNGIRHAGWNILSSGSIERVQIVEAQVSIIKFTVLLKLWVSKDLLEI